MIDTYLFQDEQINIDGGEDSIVKVLRVNQKNLVNDYVVGVFPFDNAHPKEIRALFRLITGKEGGRAEVIRDKVGKKQYLQVICPKYQLPFIEKALAALDVPWIAEDVDGSHEAYYRAKFRDIEEINEVAEIPGGSDGQVSSIDESANSVFYRGEPYRTASYLKTAQLADMFPPQLLLEASVYEVEVTNDLALGLDFVAWKCGPGKNLFECARWGFDFDQDTDASTFDPSNLPVLISGSGYYHAASLLLTAEFLDFMVRKGRAKLVTRGRLTVRNGEIGTLDNIDQVLHFQVYPSADCLDEGDADRCEPGATCDEAEDYIDALRDRCLRHRRGEVNVGISLSVVPYIGLESTELVYALSMNDIVGTTPDGNPMVRDNSVLGSVIVRDGLDICVGGLKRTEDVKSTNKIPILGSLPVLGWLFGHEQNGAKVTEMVVVLRPKVVLYSEVHKELAGEADALVRAQVMKQAPLPMLKTEYGFDMWLLGKD
jgi:type II secretory pathway component GspD/PulD (secretin)